MALTDSHTSEISLKQRVLVYTNRADRMSRFISETRPGRLFQATASVMLVVTAIDYIGIIDLASLWVYLFLINSAIVSQKIIDARLTDEHRITESDG